MKQNKYLTEGTHTAKIHSVRVKTDNSIYTTFRTDQGAIHSQVIFLHDRSGKDLMVSTKALLAATVEDPKELFELIADIEDKELSSLTKLEGKEVVLDLKSVGKYLQVQNYGKKTQKKTRGLPSSQKFF